MLQYKNIYDLIYNMCNVNQLRYGISIMNLKNEQPHYRDLPYNSLRRNPMVLYIIYLHRIKMILIFP